MSESVNDVLSYMQLSIEENNAEDTRDPLPTVRGDPNQINIPELNIQCHEIPRRRATQNPHFKRRHGEKLEKSEYKIMESA